MAATFKPRYSVSTAASDEDSFSRTSSTTATFSGRGLSIRLHLLSLSRAHAQCGRPSETSEGSTSSGGSVTHYRKRPDVFGEQMDLECGSRDCSKWPSIEAPRPTRAPR